MVRLFAGIAALMAAASGAQAQVQAAGPSADWRAAGGDMFGRPAEVTAPEAEEGASQTTPRLPELSQPFLEAIARAADRHGLDPKLLHALVMVESGYRAGAVSPAGAAGLTQLMPGTASDLGVTDRFDVEQNLFGGADYLARQLLRFGDLRLALAAYNSGPGRVARLGRVPEIEETHEYVARVLECFLALTAGRGPRNALQCRTAEPVP